MCLNVCVHGLEVDGSWLVDSIDVSERNPTHPPYTPNTTAAPGPGHADAAGGAAPARRPPLPRGGSLHQAARGRSCLVSCMMCVSMCGF